MGSNVRASIWQHEVVNSDQFDRSSDLRFDPVNVDLTKDLTKRYMVQFDEKIAPKYKLSAPREAARNNCMIDFEGMTSNGKWVVLL